MEQIKWILFDFGGCLDSDGMHSRTLFYRHFLKNGLINLNQDHSLFQEAYTYSDRKVIDQSLILNSSLIEMNEIMCTFIAEKLELTNNTELKNVAQSITDYQSEYLKRNKEILRVLNKSYNLGIISNFSGNLSKILDDFSINSYFSFILDSYHVGYCKPNPEIFKLAISKCKTTPKEICFVGDNIERDIAPAKELGMMTVLISMDQKESIADYTLTTVENLLRLTQKL